MPKSLTVSQLLGKGQLTLGNKVNRLRSPSHWGARTGRNSLRAQGCLKGHTWPWPLREGLVRRPGEGLCMALGRAKSSKGV